MSDVWDFTSSAGNVFRTADTVTLSHSDGCRSLSVVIYWYCEVCFLIALSISMRCMQKELKKLQVIIVVLTHRMAFVIKETTHPAFT